MMNRLDTPFTDERPRLTTNQKALKINLDPIRYGTFAEIGAGQEVARWFFKVGAAASGTGRTRFTKRKIPRKNRPWDPTLRKTWAPRFENRHRIVIPKRGIIARGICCFAAGNKQIPCAIRPRIGMTRLRFWRKVHDHRYPARLHRLM
jgi:hypothetical protein